MKRSVILIISIIFVLHSVFPSGRASESAKKTNSEVMTFYEWLHYDKESRAHKSALKTK